MCGSGGNFRPYVPGQVEAQVRDARLQTETADYEQGISERLQDLLQDVNERDATAINDRLADIKGVIEDYIDDSISLRFGGSVSRHTYVNGLSDVDALVLLNPNQFAADNPQDLLSAFESLLRRTLPGSVGVERGDLAVTLTYGNGLKLQLLPALRTATGVRIAASDGHGWSNVIHPERFARGLTDVNQANSGRVVPLIKIVKAMVDQFPADMRPRGHHIEALAVEAFEAYRGRATIKAMMEYFFQDAARRVRAPLRDQTGQSDYLDDYMGARDSDPRRRLSGEFDRIHTNLQAADHDLSANGWLDALGL